MLRARLSRIMMPVKSSKNTARPRVAQMGRRDATQTRHHCENVADRIQYAVAIVVERDRRLAIAVDDEVGVLENFPGAFHHGRRRKSGREGPARRNEVREAIENEAMDDVRGRVPVTDVLGIVELMTTPFHSIT